MPDQQRLNLWFQLGGYARHRARMDYFPSRVRNACCFLLFCDPQLLPLPSMNSSAQEEESTVIS